MRVKLVLGVIGHQVRLFAFAFIPPIIMALVDGEGDIAGWFGASLAIAAGLGWLMGRGFEQTRFLHRSEALAVVSGTWLVVSMFAGVPYVFLGLGPVDAFFESMSGLTTTGATILTEWDHSRAFFLWRAMTQWFGGLGVIALFVVILPRLGIAGRQLFFAEASGASSENITPQVRAAATRLWILYSGLTLILGLLLSFFGMDWYESLVHALTTLSAGGFSPNPSSISGYGNPQIEWVLVVFMVISGASYPLQFRAFSGRPLALIRDGEFVTYIVVGLLMTLILAALVMPSGQLDEEAFRQASFQVASLSSSTGYASVDYDRWGDAAKAILVLVMIIGGCAGSACGGVKVVRWIIGFKFLRREMKQILHPHAVMPIRYKNRIISPGILRAVVTLMVLYLISYFLLGVVVIVLEQDNPQVNLGVALSASLACLGNIGPGFGSVGPMYSFAELGTATKIALTLGMWLGRLELVAVFSLLGASVWRRARWGDRIGPG